MLNKKEIKISRIVSTLGKGVYNIHVYGYDKNNKFAQYTDTFKNYFYFNADSIDDILDEKQLKFDQDKIYETLYGDKVFSDSSTNDELIADYTYRALESDFPSYFSLAVQYSLASVFATSIARDDKLMEMMEVKAERLMAKARNLDSQQQTSRSLSTTRFTTNRRS